MRLLNLLKANLRKEYIELKRYLPNTIALLLTFYIIFLGLFFGIQVIGDPSTQAVNTQFVIVNYIFWYLTMVVVNDIGWKITNEATQGTLEQLSMSPMGIWRIITVRLIASTFLHFVIMVGLLYLSMATAGEWLNLDVLTLLPIFVLTIISMFGVGFMIAGLAIILKQVQAFLQILQFILAGLVFIPLATAPFLAFFPIVKGVELVRQVMIDGITLTQIPSGDYLTLLFNAVFYFGLGLGVFVYCERIARAKGLLAHY
ncbi:ABC transporter permease [Sediminibacillus dalangtanensis]|uniref:ABC transporter permease n=1 Tax=Sediminibacillus dalangtanensis TaxID=2729421 RepID=A0ABX7VW76_9BACI|nr:ABC transporter permease [Sediminibacillus dalangtanensis]QTM98861.1 ABC transporter permease [Sediminibacillus dalangtanensis]